MSVALETGLLPSLAKKITTLVGIHYPPERMADLGRRVSRLALRLEETDLDGLVNRLLDSGLGHPEWQAFLDELTVGETYFMREPRALKLLEEEVLLPLVAQRRKGDRRIRLWSAGCCTGEEAYTLAMLLYRLIPDPTAWDIRIIATDLNPTYLEAAKSGRYGAWSFRQVDPEIRSRFFRQEGELFEILPRLRSWVHFYPLNLMAPSYRALVPELHDLDCILCRNVLMYFRPEDIGRVTGRFHQVLGEGGWLVVGASETSHVHFSDFEVKCYPQAIFYRKPLVEAGEDALERPEPVHVPVHSRRVRRLAVPEFLKPAASRREELHRDDPPTAVDVVAPATKGMAWGEALDHCHQAIEADRLNPQHYRLKASLMQDKDRLVEAVAAWRTVLYLEPHDVMAHFQLANLYRRQGQEDEAMRHYRNALGLLEVDHERPVPHGDGFASGELASWIKQMMDGGMTA